MSAELSFRCGSSGGKVLIVGGYLVLQSPNNGMVLSVDARFHSSLIQMNERSSNFYITKYPPPSKVTSSKLYIPILLHCPQRSPNARLYYLYQVNSADDPSCIYYKMEGITEGEYNPFAVTAIEVSLTIAGRILNNNEHFLKAIKYGLALSLYGDHQFYQADTIPQSSILNRLDGKTGLGSSAALVSSLVTVLLDHVFNLNSIHSSTPVSLHRIQSKYLSKHSQPNSHNQYTYRIHESNDDGSKELEKIPLWSIFHRVAQLSHCLSQGKIGSGFDVAAAFFGSINYYRFQEALIANALTAIEQNKWTNEIMDNLISPDPSIENSWSTSKSIKLFEGIHLALADVKGGANTPQMVQKILKWKNENSQPDTKNPPLLWSKLGEENEKFLVLFAEVGKFVDRPLYKSTIEALSKIPPSRWTSLLPENQSNANSDKASPSEIDFEILNSFIKINNGYSVIRKGLVDISNAAGVQIEPEEQTRLLNRTNQIGGILAAGVPGAGGHDAIFVLILDNNREAAYKRLEEAWEKFAQEENRPIKRLPVNVQLFDQRGVQLTHQTIQNNDDHLHLHYLNWKLL